MRKRLSLLTGENKALVGLEKAGGDKLALFIREGKVEARIVLPANRMETVGSQVEHFAQVGLDD